MGIMQMNTQKLMTITSAICMAAEEGRRPWTDASVLTAGGKFAGANVTLAEGAPKWAKGVSVDNNEIVLNVISTGFAVILK